MNKFIGFIILFSFSINAQTLSNMYFLSEDIGWLQTIGYAQIPIKTFRTTNGGITWIQLDTMFNYKNIQFINDSVGYLFSVFRFRFEDGLQGKNLYKTTDKGVTWYFLTDSLKGLHNVMFADEMVGYADAGIAKTTDGGINWLKKSDGGYTSKFGVITKNKVIILSTADDDRYFITTNGGISWEGKEFPFPYRDTIYANSDRGLADIQFTDTLHGFVTTVTSNPQDPDFSGIYSTSDGGETWKYTRILNGERISMADSLNGIFYVAGYKLTNDGFKTFTERPRPNLNANKYFFYNCQAFYACGDSGYFAKSTDCGETWTELPFNVLNPTDVNESNNIITNYNLQQNYPNPFNPSTKIKYTIPKQGLVTIKVYDVLGKEITLLINEEKPSGEYEVEFDGSNLSSGIYFYQIQAGEFLDTIKMILLK